MDEDDLIGGFHRILGLEAPVFLEQRLARDLARSQKSFLPGEWWSYSAGMGLGTFLLFTALGVPLLLVLSSSLVLAPVLGAGFGFLVFFLLLSQPGKDRRKYAEEFEADMSLGLLVLGIALNTGMPLRKALGRLSEGYGHFSDAVQKLLADEAAGTPLPRAIDRMAAGVDSIYAQRCANIMKNAYAKPSGEAFRMLAEEMLKNNENQLREYSAKSGLLTQGSTIFTVVFPTLLVCLLVIASVIAKPDVAPVLLSLGIGFGFTLAAAAMYRYQLSKVPAFVGRLYHGGAGLCFMERLQANLELTGQGMEAEAYLWLSAAAAAGFSLVGALVSHVLGLGTMHTILMCAGMPLLCAAGMLVYPGLQYRSIQQRMEDEIPLVLEQAAQFSDSRADKVLKMMAGMGYGRLSQEFEKACCEISAGATLKQAVEKIYRDTGSALIKRGLDLLVDAHQTGIDMKNALRETAAYVQRIKYVVQESRAATTGERATQLFGFVLAAALFGVVISMGRGLADLLSGGFFEVDVATINAVALGININLLVQPMAIAYSVSSLENDRKRILIYLPILLLTGNFLYFLLQRFRLV